MVDFIRKRLQVFVSSTFTDLVNERQAAVEAILTAGHIPAGMELFTSGDESQMDVIKQWIDESDVYLLILGGLYGSVEPKSGKSYTELEYEYALSKDKPLFACVINDAALEQRVRAQGTIAVETQNAQKLKKFRKLTLTKMVRFWDDAKDIKISIGETLSHISHRDDLIGWVRATEQANMPALADEIARLSKENALLRSQVASGSVHESYNGLTFKQLSDLLMEKHLLEALVKNVEELNHPYGSDGTKQMFQLAELGIVEIIVRSHRARITDAGRSFLNKLEYQRVCNKKLEENV